MQAPRLITINRIGTEKATAILRKTDFGRGFCLDEMN